MLVSGLISSSLLHLRFQFCFLQFLGWFLEHWADEGPGSSVGQNLPTLRRGGGEGQRNDFTLHGMFLCLYNKYYFLANQFFISFKLIQPFF